MEREKLSHPGIAAVLSFIFNGLGQLYNGQIFKGLLIIFLSSLSILILTVAGIFICFWLLGKTIPNKVLIWSIALFFIGLVSTCIIGIYSILDAYRVAIKK